MKLRRIRVSNFRKLEQPVEIADLEDGITVIAGDNEEGKSTLLDAIRTGLFERHGLGGRPLEDMQPFGSTVRPQVELAFSLDDGDYRLSKTFGQRASVELVTPEGRFEGAAAEERLAEVLGFRVAARGTTKADDRGVLGLFWLEQGRAAHGLGFGETGRATLRGALEGEVGDVLAGGQGRELLNAARERRGEYLTATGRPAAAMREANEAVTSCAARVAGLEEARMHYDQELDELARVRRELDGLRREDAEGEARRALEQAQAGARAVDALAAAQREAHQALTLAETKATGLAERWSNREAMMQRVRDAARDVETAREAQAQLETRSADMASRVAAAAARAEAAQTRRSECEAAADRAEQQAHAARLRGELKASEDALAKVAQLARQRSAARERIATIAIDAKRLAAIEEKETQLREARAALDAVATRMRFDPDGTRAVTRDGEPLEPAGSHLITEPTRFTLEGFGDVTVEPGAAELEQRRGRADDLVAELRSALEAAGARDLEAARALLVARTQAETDRRDADKLIQAHAPDGEDALRDAVTRQRDALAALDDVGGEAAPPDVQAAQAAVTSARAAEQEAREALDESRQEERDHLTGLARTSERVDAAGRALSSAENALAGARQAQDDDSLKGALDTARKESSDASTRRDSALRQLEQANPEAVALALRRATGALDEVVREQARLTERGIRLEERLVALGKDGVGEQLEEARGELERARARAHSLGDEAAAWDLLVDTLARAEREAQEAFLAPVLQRVTPFLELLLPDSHVTLDEQTLEITGIRRDGTHEPFDNLSVGTREQIAVLVRLAFAVYLRERGLPALVILDDALVYADQERFDRMQLALLKAAESVQVIILTCRPRDWRALKTPRYLAEARLPG